MTHTLHFSFFETPATFTCTSELTRDLLLHQYSSLLVDGHAVEPELNYEVGGGEDGEPLYARRGTEFDKSWPRIEQFLYRVEKDMTIRWQHIRNDLYFLHASALDYGDGVILLGGRSGNGKSTTCWAMTNNGFNYLSDELSPIDPETMLVHPFPHALCLKAHPPAGYELPDTTLDAGRTLHVLPSDMKCDVIKQPKPVKAALFVEYDSDLEKPELTPLTTALSAANLYRHSLNALAHPNKGLGTAAKIVSSLSCAELKTAGLDDTCEVIWDFVRSLES